MPAITQKLPDGRIVSIAEDGTVTQAPIETTNAYNQPSMVDLPRGRREKDFVSRAKDFVMKAHAPHEAYVGGLNVQADSGNPLTRFLVDAVFPNDLPTLAADLAQLFSGAIGGVAGKVALRANLSGLRAAAIERVVKNAAAPIAGAVTAGAMAPQGERGADAMRGAAIGAGTEIASRVFGEAVPSVIGGVIRRYKHLDNPSMDMKLRDKTGGIFVEAAKDATPTLRQGKHQAAISTISDLRKYTEPPLYDEPPLPVMKRLMTQYTNKATGEINVPYHEYMKHRVLRNPGNPTATLKQAFDDTEDAIVSATSGKQVRVPEVIKKIIDQKSPDAVMALLQQNPANLGTSMVYLDTANAIKAQKILRELSFSPEQGVLKSSLDEAQGSIVQQLRQHLVGSPRLIKRYDDVRKDWATLPPLAKLFDDGQWPEPLFKTITSGTKVIRGESYDPYVLQSRMKAMRGELDETRFGSLWKFVTGGTGDQFPVRSSVQSDSFQGMVGTERISFGGPASSRGVIGVPNPPTLLMPEDLDALVNPAPTSAFRNFANKVLQEGTKATTGAVGGNITGNAIAPPAQGVDTEELQRLMRGGT